MSYTDATEEPLAHRGRSSLKTLYLCVLLGEIGATTPFILVLQSSQYSYLAVSPSLINPIASHAARLLFYMPPALNVVRFGATGHGKSSIINMVAGHQCADVSSRVTGCTFDNRHHTFNILG